MTEAQNFNPDCNPIRKMGEHRKAQAERFGLTGISAVSAGNTNLIFLIVGDHDSIAGSLIYKTLLVVTFLLFVFAFRRWKRAGHAFQGAKSEDRVIEILKAHLAPQGWKLESHVLGYGPGDIDVLMTAPSGKTFVIE